MYEIFFIKKIKNKKEEEKRRFILHAKCNEMKSTPSQATSIIQRLKFGQSQHRPQFLEPTRTRHHFWKTSKSY